MATPKPDETGAAAIDQVRKAIGEKAARDNEPASTPGNMLMGNALAERLGLAVPARGADGMYFDKTTVPPEPYRLDPLWNPDAVRSIIDLGCRIETRSKLVDPRTHLVCEGLLHWTIVDDIDPSATLNPLIITREWADKWLQWGVARKRPTGSYLFFIWGAISVLGRTFPNGYRLCIHADDDDMRVFTHGYDGSRFLPQSVRGPDNAAADPGIHKDAVAFKICDCLYNRDLAHVSCPAPIGKFVGSMGEQQSHVTANRYTRFQYNDGSREFLFSADAIERQRDGRGIVVDPNLLSAWAKGQYDQMIAQKKRNVKQSLGRFDSATEQSFRDSLANHGAIVRE